MRHLVALVLITCGVAVAAPCERGEKEKVTAVKNGFKRSCLRGRVVTRTELLDARKRTREVTRGATFERFLENGQRVSSASLSPLLTQESAQWWPADCRVLERDEKGAVFTTCVEPSCNVDGGHLLVLPPRVHAYVDVDVLPRAMPGVTFEAGEVCIADGGACARGVAGLAMVLPSARRVMLVDRVGPVWLDVSARSITRLGEGVSLPPVSDRELASYDGGLLDVSRGEMKPNPCFGSDDTQRLPDGSLLCRTGTRWRRVTTKRTVECDFAPQEVIIESDYGVRVFRMSSESVAQCRDVFAGRIDCVGGLD